MITTELDFLKSHDCLEQLIERVRQSGKDGRRIDEVERELFAGLMQMGFHLLMAFVRQAGDGDVGETVSVSADVKTSAPVVEGESVRETRTWRRLEQLHTRSYHSIFGGLTIPRHVYGTREDQKIEVVPLDARLGLPLGKFSYVLEDWQQRMCLKESFLEATGNLSDLLGVAPSVRAAEVMNRKMAEFAPGFRQEQPTPPADEEGELVVFTADGKGIPMRRPGAAKQPPSKRRAKGEKANKKQMSYVGAVYTIDRFVRTPDDVLEELSRTEAKTHRPKPRHKHVAAEMTRVIEGEECNGRVSLFGVLSDEALARNHDQNKPVVAVMDGERALWEVLKFFLPKAIGILDIFHVSERLWQVAHIFHPENSPSAGAFVTHRLRLLLEGQVGRVIGGLLQIRSKHRLTAAKLAVLNATIGYFENNRDHMRYNDYLASGYPIGSGVAEGACRHLVKDRMEQTGMRWTVEGAQALLNLRAMYLNGDWKTFIDYRIQREQAEIYPYKPSLAA